MTGRDLILYILSNNLEDEPVFKNGNFIGFITAGQAAQQMGVGVATIYAWIHQGRIDGMIFCDTVYIPADFQVKKEGGAR